MVVDNLVPIGVDHDDPDANTTTARRRQRRAVGEDVHRVLVEV
jgi:hypothetical protein